MKEHGPKRYFFRLFSGIISILLIFTILLMAGFYTSMRQYVSRSESGKNELIISQVSYSLSSINNVIRNLCSAIFYSPDAQVLMYHQGPDDYSIMQRLNRIKTLANREPGLVHSVYVLNAGKGITYSTFRSYTIQDELCEQLMRSQAPLPVLKPMLRTFYDELTGQTQPLLSYFFYELSSTDGLMQNGVVVNVSVHQYLDSLHHLNQSIQDGSKLYLYSIREGQFISGADPLSPEVIAIEELLSDRVAITAQPGMNVVDSLSTDEGNYVITYHFWESVGWVIIQAQPVLTLYEYMNSISTTLFSISLLILALAVVAYYVVSRWLYSPVRNIISQLPPIAPGKKGDEFSAIYQALERYREDNAALAEKHHQYTNSARHFHLRQIIQNGASLGAEKIAAISKENNYRVDLSMPLHLCLMRILNFNELKQNNSARDVALLVYSVQNISKEIMDGLLPNEYIEMSSDTVVFVIPADQNNRKCIASAAAQIRQACQQYLLVHTSFTLSSISDNPANLWDHYRQLCDQSKYHLVLGTEVLVTAEMVQRLEKGDDLQPVLEKEEDILKKLHLPLPVLHMKLHDLFEELKRLNYDSIVYVITRMQGKLMKAAAASHMPYARHYEPGAALEYGNFENLSLTQIEQIITDQINAIQANNSQADNALVQGIAGRAKAFIDIHYADANLNAAFLTDHFEISPSTLSRAFRRELDMTVPEYINIVRMSHAIDMMRTSNRSIAEIMKRVGIENESHFYRTFKKAYHVTPREYIASMEDDTAGSAN